MSDFHVYYKAAQRVVHGENLFRPVEDGFYHFKYSPTSAIFFIPFSVLPYSSAKVAYWFFLCILICLGLYMGLKMLEPEPADRKDHSRTNSFILLSALVVSVHFFRELELGQVNHVLLVLYISTLFLFWKKKSACLGAIWSASLFLKPFSLVFLPWWGLLKKWKIILIFAAGAVFWGMLPVVFYGFSGLRGQYDGWFTEMAIELSHKQSLLAPGNHTVFSVLARYTPLRFTPIVTTYANVYQAVVTLAIGMLFLVMYKKREGIDKPIVLEGAFLISLIPLFAFTSYNAFGFVELSVMIILFYFKKLSVPLRITAISGMALSGGNIYEIMGRKMWAVINNLSLVGIGAMLLLVVLFCMRNRKIC
jgi:hypothetical protein